jgi:hypothetical protein
LESEPETWPALNITGKFAFSVWPDFQVLQFSDAEVHLCGSDVPPFYRLQARFVSENATYRRIVRTLPADLHVVFEETLYRAAAFGPIWPCCCGSSEHPGHEGN